MWIRRAGLCVVLLALLAVSMPANGGMSVYDHAAQRTRRDQLRQERQQGDILRRSLEFDRQQFRAMTGNRGYGDALPSGFQSRLPDGSLGLANLLSGVADGILGKLVRHLIHKDGLEIRGPIAETGARSYHNRRLRRSQGQEALARTAYQETAEDLEVVRALSRSIESAFNPKDILDLHARLLAQGAKSSLIAARIFAAAELNRARQSVESADRALRVQRMVEPRFINPRLGK